MATVLNESYLGKLDYADPLYEILLSGVCPNVDNPLFHVNGTSSRRVYKYTEEKTRIAIIGKFFEPFDSKKDRITRIKGEYDNLKKIRGYGFDSSPHYVVRPIAREEKIGLALIEDFIQGKDLDHYLKKAIYEGSVASLNDKLTKLSFFLYKLHSKTESGRSVELDHVTAYFQKIINKLCRQGIIPDNERKKYMGLMDRWMNRTLLQRAKSVIVHGDATPTNFIFTSDGDVAAIDLERIKDCDAAFDIGMVCGELKHAFMWRTDNPCNAEPFIRHFLKSYSDCSDNRKRVFKEITARNPFYMALTELRIARNDYLDWGYRQRLVYEALGCLKWGLKLG